MAQHLVHAVVGVLAPGVVPLFLTDQLVAYGKALLTHFGCWVERVSEKSGRILHRWMPDERLRYAQVKKPRTVPFWCDSKPEFASGKTVVSSKAMNDLS
jgi:hypothetical protein